MFNFILDFFVSLFGLTSYTDLFLFIIVVDLFYKKIKGWWNK